MWKQAGQKDRARGVPGVAGEEAQSMRGHGYHEVTQQKAPHRKEMFTHILKITLQTRDSPRTTTTETHAPTSEGQKQ